MTGLQLLACNPSVFKSGSKQTSFVRLIYSRVSMEDATATEEGVSMEDATATEEVETCCRVPLVEAVRKKMRRYESALQLAKFLIEKDTSWFATESLRGLAPKIHKYGETFTTPQGQGVGEGKIFQTDQERRKKIPTTPLFLATKSGCTEIVEEILQMYPQAVEHIDDDGRSILHVAIKYRQVKILDIVEKMEIPMMRLVRKIDKFGNSILHMVGLKTEDGEDEDMRSPALLLQENLLFYERVKKMSKSQFIKHLDSGGKKAAKLFAGTYDALRKDAKKWLQGAAQNCSIVAVLIATVAFAAAYTAPGGPNHEGYPVLLSQPFFVIFTIADVLSVTLALTSVITFLSILTSPFQFKDFKYSLPQKLMLGLTLLMSSVLTMMLAFAATIILLLIRKQRQWTRIALYSIAFFPVTIFSVSYLPLYASLMKTSKYSLRKIGMAYPRCNILQFLRSPFHLRKSHAKIPSNPTQSQASSSSSSSCSPTSQTTHYPV